MSHEESLRRALTGRYTIERELGRGGNAVVYLAHDLKHDRQVALKVLNPELALSVRTERFLREIQIAAKLTHPHILTLIDSGRAGESLFYVMPYVEGESLRDRLNREKQLAVADAIKITTDVAAALSYAHAQGVVHRDIKPENILLAHGGEAVVADFGIARALSVAVGEGVTEAGVAVGTPAYMSPEQSAGSAQLDARSDIYSLGCVLYEMLTGHVPYQGTSAQEVLSRHALDAIPSARASRHAVTETVDRAIRRALGKAPADRYLTTAEFAAALAGRTADPRRRRMGYMAAGVVVAMLVPLARSWQNRRSADPDPSLAVIPFENLSNDSAERYFSEGMTEEITSALGHIAGLRIIPVTAAYLEHRGKGLDVRSIGVDLGVARVLTGKIRHSGSQLRVSAALVNSGDGSQVWSEVYPRELRDVFAVQEEIARAVVTALRLRFAIAGAGQTARRPTDNTEAYELYLKGRALYSHRTRTSISQALDYYNAAIAKDSNYALAWAGVATVYNQLYRFSYASLAETGLNAEKAAARALALDSNLAESHAAMGVVLHSFAWDWDGAEREFRRAIELNPTFPDAHEKLGFLLASTLGRFDEGVSEARTARELEMLSPEMWHNLVSTLIAARRYDEAVEVARGVVSLEPESPQSYQRLGAALLGKGLYREAIEASKTSDGLQPGVLGPLVTAVQAHLGMGDSLEAKRLLAQIEASPRAPGVGLARIYARLGDFDRAFSWLDSAYRRHEWALTQLGGNVGDPFRSDPRLAGLLKRMGLKPAPPAPSRMMVPNGTAR